MKLGNFRRKKYLIDAHQYRLMGISFMYVAAIVLVFAGALFIPVVIQLHSGSISSPIVQDAARQFLVFHTRLWPPVMLLIVLLVLHNVLVSHRIFGPLHRIRDELRKIGDGNLFGKVKLRKADYLTKEANAVNQMIEALRTKIRAIDQKQGDARTLLVELQRAVIRGSADEINGKIEELSAAIERLQHSIGQFELRRDMPRSPKTTEKRDQSKPPGEPVGASAETRG
ncbi:MAG: methyl-accepting chemotaxis protein [Candidatus Latescibacterota bacterium]|nr:MAG: methyl-accepting chemotaxis protein [Candidatus Latescibacterota bacterium]